MTQLYKFLSQKIWLSFKYSDDLLRESEFNQTINKHWRDIKLYTRSIKIAFFSHFSRIE